MKPTITYDDFIKLDLRVGKITACAKKEQSSKLLRLTVDFGEEGTRTILSGISKFYSPEELIDKEFIFVLNLEPRKIMGEESQGMILCTDEEKPLPLQPLSAAKPGAPIV